jgi:hypothetical protein
MTPEDDARYPLALVFQCNRLYLMLEPVGLLDSAAMSWNWSVVTLGMSMRC